MEGELTLGFLIRHRISRYRTRIEHLLNTGRSNTHQSSHRTRYDRYPEIFDAVKSLLPESDLRILSFGCSSGEETATLTAYFPAAQIVGADISPYALRTAARRCRNLPNVSFVNNAKTDITDVAPFDAVFAMSVLCRHPETKHIEDSSEIYSFETFERMCDKLAALLGTAGLLVIYNANYRFTDTSTAEGFALVKLPAVTDSGFVVKFDRDGLRLRDQEYAFCVFEKTAS